MRDKDRLPENKVPDNNDHDEEHDANPNDRGVADLFWFVSRSTKPLGEKFPD
ncbi:MAG: hypothetical protein WC342_06620 [Methanoregula sp.]